MNVRLQSISKSFPGVKALEDVSINFQGGSVHALCGENGAGKSTLMHIIAGNLQPESGQIFVDNRAVTIANVKQAQEKGIGIVYQERCLAEALSVAENIFAVNPPRSAWGFIDYRAMYWQTKKLLDELGLASISPETTVDKLSPASRQMVEIAKVLVQEPSLLILDEPTASLTPAETAVLFSVIRRLVKNGTGIIYISHRMAEIAGIADTVSVLKDGRYQGSFDAKNTPVATIVNKMVGRILTAAKYVSHVQKEAALETDHLYGDGFSDISFTLFKGEILGISGLDGSGRTALARALFGDTRITAGKIIKSGSLIVPRHPADAIAAGIAYLPDERKSLGLFMHHTIAENIGAAGLHGGLFHERETISVGNTLKNRLSIKARSVQQPVQELSGGNQQKVVLAKWLHTRPDILIINEPTHGVDIGAKEGIYDALKELTSMGKSILLISSELTELILLCNRIMVMYNGYARGILSGDEITEERLAALASGI